MQRTQWNDDEDRAMDYLPHLDQVIYLRGIRRRMDYVTGMAGMHPDGPISYSWLAQLAEVRPRACSTMRPPPRPDKNALRSVFDRLESAGLVERIRDHGLKSLVFRCLLADRDQSVRNMSHPSATHEPPTNSHPAQPSNGAAYSGMSHPSATHQQIDMSHPIPESGIRKKKPPLPPLFALPPSVDPSIWAEFEAHRKEIGKPLTDRARGTNAKVLAHLPVDLQRAVVETTISNGWTGLFPQKVNGHATHRGTRETDTERRARINAETIARGFSATADPMD